MAKQPLPSVDARREREVQPQSGHRPRLHPIAEGLEDGRVPEVSIRRATNC